MSTSTFYYCEQYGGLTTGTGQVQPYQWVLRLPEQQDHERPPQGRAWVPGLCEWLKFITRLGAAVQSCGAFHLHADSEKVMSDWGGTHTGVSSANAGLDMDMPGGVAFLESGTNAHSFFGGNITAAVDNGTVSIDRLDDMVRRIMTPYFYLGQTSYPPIDGSTYGLNYWSREYLLRHLGLGHSRLTVRSFRCRLQLHFRAFQCRCS